MELPHVFCFNLVSPFTIDTSWDHPFLFHRLIVVAEKQVVYDKFPIPLINRLEKHFLTLNNIMNKDQLDLAEALEKWAKEFVSTGPAGPITRARAR